MKKYLLLLCIPLLLLLTSCEDDTYSIDNVSIDAQINADGTIHVRELFTYTFSGDFNGTTRAIKSDVKDFTAYLANDMDDPTVSTENLSELKTEYDDDDEDYKIYTSSENETKTVLYDYDVEGAVKKYSDVGTTLYTFFKKTNDTDIHDLNITLHSPSNSITDDTFAYLHDEDPEKLAIENEGVTYYTALLKEGASVPIRFIFPTEELQEQSLTEDAPMKDRIIKSEEDLAKKYAHLDENMKHVKPFVWALFPILIILWFIFFRKHPSSKVKEKDEAEVVQVLETMDPLFVKYLFDSDVTFGRNVTNESIIAALFSLRRRGIVSMKKTPSEAGREEETFRFTWVDYDKKVDKSDRYLKRWLFTEKDASGPYFLLESITVDEDASDSVKEEKGKRFEKGMEKWSERVKSKEGYYNLRRIFPPYRILSIPIIMMTFGLFYYFTQIDAITNTTAWVLPLTFGLLALISFVFNRNKWILSVFQLGTIIASFIWFTLTTAVILSIVFYALALIILLISPSKYWITEIRELKQVIDQARKMFKKGEYPVSADPATNEKQLEYAIILDAGEQYGEKCEQHGPIPTIPEYYPLLMNPSFVVNTMATSSLVFYTTAAASSSTGTSSGGGGGGAGAF